MAGTDFNAGFNPCSRIAYSAPASPIHYSPYDHSRYGDGASVITNTNSFTFPKIEELKVKVTLDLSELNKFAKFLEESSRQFAATAEYIRDLTGDVGDAS